MTTKRKARLPGGSWVHPFTATTMLDARWDFNYKGSAKWRCIGCQGLRLHLNRGRYEFKYEHSYRGDNGKTCNNNITDHRLLREVGMHKFSSPVKTYNYKLFDLNAVLNTPPTNTKYGRSAWCKRYDRALAAYAKALRSLLIAVGCETKKANARHEVLTNPKTRIKMMKALPVDGTVGSKYREMMDRVRRSDSSKNLLDPNK
jgi:hypothetical protein